MPPSSGLSLQVSRSTDGVAHCGCGIFQSGGGCVHSLLVSKEESPLYDMDFNAPGTVVEIHIPNAQSLLHFVDGAFVRTAGDGSVCCLASHRSICCHHVSAVQAHVNPGGAASEAERAAADDALVAEDDLDVRAAAAGLPSQGACGAAFVVASCCEFFSSCINIFPTMCCRFAPAGALRQHRARGHAGSQPERFSGSRRGEIAFEPP